MNYSGEAAEQVVRMSLNGVEVAAKISGKAAERLAVLLYAVLREQKKTRGKIRLTNMLKNGKELKVFTVRDNELQKFCEEAKKYGVLYCVPKDNKAEDGLTDIMVRAEDAGKINRIFERFQLATVDMGSVKSEIERSRREKAAEEFPEPERSAAESDKTAQLVDSMLQKPDKEQEGHTPNPAQARTTKSPQSEPISRPSERSERDISNRERVRPSVRQELKDIKAEQAAKAAEKAKDRAEKMPATEHHAPKKKRRKRKER